MRGFLGVLAVGFCAAGLLLSGLACGFRDGVPGFFFEAVDLL
jgi:hypothetical protein